MSDPIYPCGSHCEHAHDGLNGPTGCCPKGHGPYLYYCYECHEEWRQANPEAVRKIARLTKLAHRDIEDWP